MSVWVRHAINVSPLPAPLLSFLGTRSSARSATSTPSTLVRWTSSAPPPRSAEGVRTLGVEIQSRGTWERTATGMGSIPRRHLLGASGGGSSGLSRASHLRPTRAAEKMVPAWGLEIRPQAAGSAEGRAGRKSARTRRPGRAEGGRRGGRRWGSGARTLR